MFIKFHPVTNHNQMEEWVSSIPDGYKPNIKTFHEDENTYDLMSLSDICVLVQPSTTGLEAVSFGKPLVHLDVKMRQKLPYSFTEFKVAVKMTPAELGKAISRNKDFSKIINKKNINEYLKNELSDTKNAIDMVTDISKKVIKANLSKHHKPTETSMKSDKGSDKEWSIILPLSNRAKNILKQLEAIALNSENDGTFEVILIEPVSISKESSDILDSLKGDVTRLIAEKGLTIPEMMNKASKIATGKTLLFLDKNLLPLPKWLYYLKKGIINYGKNRILGTRIIDKRNSIVHAGIVLDENHAPVSVYKYLSAEFPNAIKERSFKMLDHFICINKAFFHEIGGFWEKTGKFAFMDICLRADTYRKDKDSCIYIPDACMMSLNESKEIFNFNDSIYFFGKWHGILWENQERLYSTDKITKAELNAARMAQSMETANLIE
ncbi:MAG: glycosyltransferase [Desulfobacula sp.]|nr:glycosyltransferase [Desulfobacula sp.]